MYLFAPDDVFPIDACNGPEMRLKLENRKLIKSEVEKF